MPATADHPHLSRAPAAVIGAGGFIGSHLVAALRLQGVPAAGFTRAAPFLHGGVPAPGLRRARTVFHLATSINIGLAERSPELVAADHALFRGLVTAIRRSGHRPTLVIASSGGSVYDPAVRPPYAESSPVRALTAYGRARLRMERELLDLEDVLEPLILRLSNPYGPGQQIGTGQGVVAHWLHAAARDEPLRVFGDPRATRDYVYIDDAVEAMVRAHHLTSAGLEQPSPPRPLPKLLNIGSGEPVSLSLMLEAVREVIDDRKLVVELERGRYFDRRDTWLDVRAAGLALGWRATTPLVDGLRRTWEHLLESDPLARASGRHAAVRPGPR